MFKESSGIMLDKTYKLLGVGGFGFVFIGELIDQVNKFLHAYEN